MFDFLIIIYTAVFHSILKNETNADILFSEIANIHLIIFVDNALIIRKQLFLNTKQVYLGEMGQDRNCHRKVCLLNCWSLLL